MASNIVEILIGAKDDAKLDLDSLRAKLDELAHKVAEARVGVQGDKEAELALDRLGVKLTAIGKKTERPKISLEGAFKAATELGALDLALDRVGDKAGQDGNSGLRGRLAGLASNGVTALGNLSTSGVAFLNPLTIGLGALAAIIAGPLLASLAPITLGFVAFGGVAVSEITKIIAAHQKLQAAQASYAKATTTSGKSSALAAEKAALAGLSGPEKQVMSLMSGLSDQFHKLEKAVQPQVVKAFGSALKIIKDLMPAIRPLAEAAGKAIDGFLQKIDSWLRSDSGKKFIKWMQSDGPHAIETFGKVMWDVAQGVGRTFDFLNNAGHTWMHNVSVVIDRVKTYWDELSHAASAVGRAVGGDFDAMASTISGAVSRVIGLIHDLEGALDSVNSHLGGIPGKALGFLGLATGGIAGAATGGVRAGMTLVGEHGPELVQLSAGSRVYNNSQSRQMMAGASGGGGNSYSISVQVAPGGHPAETGRQIVNAIREFERGSGKGWRS